MIHYQRLFTLLKVAIAGFLSVAVGTLTAEDMPEEILIEKSFIREKFMRL